jgi:hypothetical protein
VSLRRTGTVALVGLIAFVALASPARAATVSVDGSLLRIAAGPGEANALTVAAAAPDPATRTASDPAARTASDPAARTASDPAAPTASDPAAPGPTASFSVADAGAPLTPGPGCASTDAGVTCVTPADPAIDVLAGDLDDSVTVAVPVGAFVDGGSGDDVIQIRDAATDSALCGSGRDTVTTEVLDFLDMACESVDYGPAGSVGALSWRTGGGRWVEIPGQTWARVDRRILPDVLYVVRRYHVRITEGYGTIGHEPFGEHPLGLAVDIEPGPGGTWADVSRLAAWAEPRQNHPRAPFRWVGWNGDFNHGHPSVCKPRLGCAPHLHLSWSHSPTPPRHVARTVRVFDVR